ncbi:MAG TPA: regulatory protein RecX [Thermoanaerobaculia bacterium]|nr:regulatory protein RecX [Thermoanaerobaculia bacterium]
MKRTTTLEIEIDAPGAVALARPTTSAYHKAVELLARRDHFRAEIRAKLVARRYPEGEIEAALDRLESEGYLDDRRTARQLADSRLNGEPLGRKRLAADLVRRGVAAEVVAQVVEELLPSDDRDAARAAARLWLDRRGGAGHPAALARYLDRRGFTPPAIWAVLEDVDPGGDADP